MNDETDALLNKLCAKIDNGEALDEYERGVKETIEFIYEGGEAPEVE
jgi:hypothetical protein